MKYDKSGTKIIYENKSEYIKVQTKRSLRFKPFSYKRLKRHIPHLKFIQRHISESSIILDAGCRNGLIMQWFMGEMKCTNVHGIDIVARNIKECKKGNLSVVEGDCRKMFMFKKEMFHLVYCTHTLEHIPKPQKAIAEFHRVLGKDGLCFMVVPLQDPFPPLKNGHSFVFTSPKTLDHKMNAYFTKQHSAIHQVSEKQQEYWYLGVKKNTSHKSYANTNPLEFAKDLMLSRPPKNITGS